MKKFYLAILLVALTVAFVSAQQPLVTIKGHVTNKQTGDPVAGQTMYLMLDSLNSAYYNKAVTDENGFYTFNLPFMPGKGLRAFSVYTNDCNGSIVSHTGTYLTGNESITINFSICGNSQSGCEASFKYLSASGNNLQVAFYDGSHYLPASTKINYTWSFGDSTTSNEQNPVHAFKQKGTYYVCQSIKSGDEICSSIYCVAIAVGSWNSDPCENYFVYHTDSTTNEYIFEGSVMNGQTGSWVWDFGDGTSAKGQKVSHSFAGTNTKHNVCLTTSGAGPDGTTCTSKSCQDLYSYIPAPCESSFLYFPDSSGSGYTFEGYSKNNQINSWKWDFGDGNTATGQMVSHTFTSPNKTFTVCLTTSESVVNNAACTYSLCKDVYYSFPSPCENSFWYQADSLSQTYTFQGWSQNSQVSTWNWDFGDGKKAMGQTVTHSFADKNLSYTVCLTTTTGVNSTDSAACSYSTCQDVFVYKPSLCESSFWYQPLSSGMSFAFEGNCKNKQVSAWIWDFGDGTTATGQKVSHSFNYSPGSTGGYHVCLTTIGISAAGDSCTFNSCQNIYFNPPSPCENYFKILSEDGSKYTFSGTVAFGAKAAYNWNFGDGTSDSGQVVTHSFGKILAVFNVCLTTVESVPAATGLNVCKSISCQVIYNGVDSSACKAVFSAVPESNENVYHFFNQSQSNYSYSYWNFGDGGQSTETNPVHTYSSPGLYIACLTIAGNNNCKNQSCQEIWVNMIQDGCKASFYYFSPDSLVNTGKYMFINTTKGIYSNLKWSFGDGTGSTDFNPVHTYFTPGIYTACLTIWDSLGRCQNSYCTDIVAGKITGDNTVSGVVMTGNTLADKAIVWLINPNNTFYAETQIDSTGAYKFNGVPYGSYYIYAMLTPGSNEFFAYMPTYYPNSLSWQGATIINTNEPNAWYPVNLISSKDISNGNATITGTIFWSGKIKADGIPAANVEVVLYNNSGNPIAYTFTDSEGTFEFNSLPFGEYTVQAETPGKVTQLIGVSLSESNSAVFIDFKVNESAIYLLGIEGLNYRKLLAGNPYPNPVNEILNLKLNGSASETAVVEIIDLQGRMIQKESVALSGGSNLISIATGNLNKGIYFLRVNSEGYKPVQRKFIK